MPEAMNPPLNFLKFSCGVPLSYTSILWKSCVSAAFYADFCTQVSEKTIKIGLARMSMSQNGPFLANVDASALTRAAAAMMSTNEHAWRGSTSEGARAYID
jgi:hypothetical protein